MAGASERAEGGDDQRVSREDGERDPERDMRRRFAAAQLRVVEAGQVVVHERSAVHELDRGRGPIGSDWIGVPVCGGDSEAKGRAKPRSTAEDPVQERLTKPRRSIFPDRLVECATQGAFDAQRHLFVVAPTRDPADGACVRGVEGGDRGRHSTPVNIMQSLFIVKGLHRIGE
jgi:hypothetical protein